MNDIESIIKWYSENTNIQNVDKVIEYLLTYKLLPSITKSVIDDLLLEKYDGEFITDKNNHYILKKNRIKFINSLNLSKTKKVNKFKLNIADKNNVKLIKLN